MNNQAKFLEAHRVARLTRHIVGDYQVAFTIALLDLNKPTIAPKIVKIKKDYDFGGAWLLAVFIITLLAIALCSFIGPFYMILFVMVGVLVSSVAVAAAWALHGIYLFAMKQLYTVKYDGIFHLELIK